MRRFLAVAASPAILVVATIAANAAFADELSARLPDGRQRAFPTAEGSGAAAIGGRGGRVMFVDTLEDGGEGSLRACVEAEGPRTCIFRVGGTIELQDEPLIALNPFLTIAGETAPGDGIAIRNGAKQVLPSLQIKADDVIVRYLRLRPGPHIWQSCCSGALGMYNGASNIMIDHVSASWGSDETIDSREAFNITIQWSIVSEPLLNGGPGKKHRARNMLLTKGRNFSVHHTLFALGKFRNPQIAPEGDASEINVINNVLYSPIWSRVISFSDRWSPVRANVIGNYKIAGRKEVDDRLVHLFAEGTDGFQIYLAGNYDETYMPDDKAPQSEGLLPETQGFFAAEPQGDPGIRFTDAQQAYDDVLNMAGATLPHRDAVDLRIVDTVRNRTGQLLKNDPETVGGWPELKTAAAPADADSDGMPDEWERRMGLNPNDPTDANLDKDNDGWTNLEEYLHEIAGDGQGMTPVTQ